MGRDEKSSHPKCSTADSKHPAGKGKTDGFWVLSGPHHPLTGSGSEVPLMMFGAYFGAISNEV